MASVIIVSVCIVSASRSRRRDGCSTLKRNRNRQSKHQQLVIPATALWPEPCHVPLILGPCTSNAQAAHGYIICIKNRVTAARYVEPSNSRDRENRKDNRLKRKELPRIMRNSMGCSEPLKRKFTPSINLAGHGSRPPCLPHSRYHTHYGPIIRL